MNFSILLSALACLALGTFTLIELTRAYVILKQWSKGTLPPDTTQQALWLGPFKIALGGTAMVIGAFNLSGLGLFAFLAGLLLAASPLITRSEILLRYKPVRMLRGLRIIFGIVALGKGALFFLDRLT